MMIDTQTVLNCLRDVIDPCLKTPLLARHALHLERKADDAFEVIITLGYPANHLHESIRSCVLNVVNSIAGIRLSISFDERIQSYPVKSKIPALPRVKNIIAVASGKGGVGKSSVSVNLALALAQAGACVGLLDADIYGPSQPAMLGVADDIRPEFLDKQYFKPIEAYGLQTMSIGYLVTDKTPMVWRGPMVSGALQQLTNQCLWQDVDYLIIDMPPGTGDIQLTMAQKIPVTASVIVTTPQNIAVLDAQKAIEMWSKVHVPVAGVIENMATHLCSQCGHEEAIFGEDGGTQLSQEYQTPLLGRLPLTKTIREHLDQGKPTVIQEPDSAIAHQYRDIATAMAAQLLTLTGNTARAAVIATD